MKTKMVRFITREKMDEMLAKGELVVKRRLPGETEALVVPAGRLTECGLLTGYMADDILGKELRIVHSKAYGCWRTGLWSIPDWLIQISEELPDGTDN